MRFNPTSLLFLLLFLLMYGLAGQWDYEDAQDCLTDTECMEMYGGDGGPE